MIGIVLWLGGIVLIAVGYVRVRAPWARLQALKAEDANIARYEAWRGGIRSEGKTGASVAMDILRRQVRVAGTFIVIGFVLVLVGFLLPA
jgi:hypothetical protein